MTPLRQNTARKAIARTVERRGTPAARARWSGMALAFTVLFVDDDPEVRQSIVDVLSLKGFRVLAAESAFEGLRVLTQEHVDVLLSDVVMPGMSGIELAKKARRLRPDLKIMFATGYLARAPEVDHLGKLFIKPIRPHQIETELCELMSLP